MIFNQEIIIDGGFYHGQRGRIYSSYGNLGQKGFLTGYYGWKIKLRDGNIVKVDQNNVLSLRTNDIHFNEVDLLNENLKTIQERKKPMDSLKNYYNKHQDSILTLGLVLLVDYFMFGGALRERI